MKLAVLIFLLSAVVLHASADEPTYLPTIKAAHERLRVLEAERQDYRKSRPLLPAGKEEERLHLLGQLFGNDPVWVLSQQVQADISAISSLNPQLPADIATVDALKELLAIISGFEERATTDAQAEQFATALRQFVVRRDLPGAQTWAKSQ